MSAPMTIANEVQAAESQRLFELQQKEQLKIGNTTAKQRIAKLKKLQKAVMNPYLLLVLYK